jgi:hypothetical protein
MFKIFLSALLGSMWPDAVTPFTTLATLYKAQQLPYILESNPHPFYSFRGLKNQMRIRFAV